MRAWLVVQNASAEPVWNVTVSFLELRASDDPGTWNEWQMGVLPPGSIREQEAGWTVPEQDEPLRVSFRDNANRWWMRSEAGYLLPLPGDPNGETVDS